MFEVGGEGRDMFGKRYGVITVIKIIIYFRYEIFFELYFKGLVSVGKNYVDKR